MYGRALAYMNITISATLICEILSYLVIQDVIEIWDRNRIQSDTISDIDEILKAFGKPKIYLSVCHFHANTAF